MKVKLVDCTGYGLPNCEWFAKQVLIRTKNTRIDMRELPLLKDKQMDEEIDYIARTVPSSWEFLNYTFLITGVSRAFTHQLVRTRTASYAQQAMRVTDQKDFKYLPINVDESTNIIYEHGMDHNQYYL